MISGSKSKGQKAYEAYCHAYPGYASAMALATMPWEKLGEGVRLAWEEAAKAGR
jgi:hypothetical protein